MTVDARLYTTPGFFGSEDTVLALIQALQDQMQIFVIFWPYRWGT